MNEGDAGSAGETYEGDASPSSARPVVPSCIASSRLANTYAATEAGPCAVTSWRARLCRPGSASRAGVLGDRRLVTRNRALFTAAAGGCLHLVWFLAPVDRRAGGALSALVGAALIPMVADLEQRASLAALLALLVGGVFFGAWVARLGWIADYFSRPVLIGYLHGVAVVLIVGQLGKMLGLSINAETPPGQLIEVIREITDLSWSTLAVGLVSLAPCSCSLGSRRSSRPTDRRWRDIVVSAVVGPGRQGGGRSRPYSLRPSQPRAA